MYEPEYTQEDSSSMLRWIYVAGFICLLLISGCDINTKRKVSAESCHKYTIEFGNAVASYYYRVDDVVIENGFYIVEGNIKYPEHTLFKITENQCKNKEYNDA